jgi:hypothetical protein
MSRGHGKWEVVDLLPKGEDDTGNLLDRYQRASNTLRRLLESLGLQRRAKDITTIDAELGNVWPQYRAGEHARAARDADRMTKLINALGDDNDKDGQS